jgi:hypothetical protein
MEMLLGPLAFAVVIAAQFLAVVVIQSARHGSGSIGGPRSRVRARPLWLVGHRTKAHPISVNEP